MAAVSTGGTSLAATAGKIAVKEGVEEVVEQAVKKNLDDIAEAGGKKTAKELAEAAAKKKGPPGKVNHKNCCRKITRVA
ncbi:MAG: hypothetical protein ACK5IC_09980 [Moheibacter sp.]